MVEIHSSTFVRPSFSALRQDDSQAVCSILHLIKHNAQHNADHRFCLQAEQDFTSSMRDGRSWTVRTISFKDLYNAVGVCCSTLIGLGIANETRTSQRGHPIAVYLESDVTLFIYVAALMALNRPVVLLSARLSADNVNHLLSATKAKDIVVSDRTSRILNTQTSKLVTIHKVANYAALLQSDGQREDAAMQNWMMHTTFKEYDTEVIILHSSGTTGLPKPIGLGHRYLLGYAACHSFPDNLTDMWPNLSTLPLYHGFGMLAPCLSLAVGMFCCFPASSIIPGARSTIDMIHLFGAKSLMSVPSIMEDIVGLEEPSLSNALRNLSTLRFVAVGGGPLKQSVANVLDASSVPLLNHYGATEIGAIAPIFELPQPGYDRQYLRLRKDIGLQLRPVESTEHAYRFKLIGYPFGWGVPFEIQDEIERRTPQDKDHLDIRIIGRRDDLIVLSTGEKVSPRLVEESLMADKHIKTAVCIGEGLFELVVIIEPFEAAELTDEALQVHAWRLLENINGSLDRHARVSSKEAVIVKSSAKAIPRSDKGSVMRKEVRLVFEDEIREAVAALDAVTSSSQSATDTGDLEARILKALKSIVDEKFFENQDSRMADFFEHGMDSLQATRLARALSTISAPRSCQMNSAFSRDFIYQNPSVEQILRAVQAAVGNTTNSVPGANRKARMLELASEFTRNLPENGANVLLTGSTGNLGAHVLAQLARSERVSTIVCFDRKHKGDAGDSQQRQRAACDMAGLNLDAQEWGKVSRLNVDLRAELLDLAPESHRRLTNSITHIIHLAWPMDFNRILDSYHPQLESLQGLLKLCSAIHEVNPNRLPRLLFASSIAVVRNHHERTGGSTVTEGDVDDPLVCAEFGYSEAKWICEKMLEHAAKSLTPKLVPINVRIGQLSGPEHSPGVWKTQEHIPQLLKSSQRVGAFPELQGNFSWLPVDRAARSLVELLMQPVCASGIHYHLENPIRQPLGDLGVLSVRELGLTDGIVPYDEWLSRVAASAEDMSLMEFYRKDFIPLSSGLVVLDTTKARQVSRSLRGSSGCSKELIVEYMRRWKKDGFLY